MRQKVPFDLCSDLVMAYFVSLWYMAWFPIEKKIQNKRIVFPSKATKPLLFGSIEASLSHSNAHKTTVSHVQENPQPT